MASAPHSSLSVARHRGADPPPHSSLNSTFLPSLLNVAECQNDMFLSAAKSMRFGLTTSLMSSNRPRPAQAPPASPISGYTVTSWHWLGPVGGPWLPRPRPPAAAGCPAPATCGAAPGCPLPAAAGVVAPAGAAAPGAAAPGAPAAPGAAAAAPGAPPGAPPRPLTASRSGLRGATGRPLNTRGELTIAACDGAFSGT